MVESRDFLVISLIHILESACSGSRLTFFIPRRAAPDPHSLQPASPEQEMGRMRHLRRRNSHEIRDPEHPASGSRPYCMAKIYSLHERHLLSWREIFQNRAALCSTALYPFRYASTASAQSLPSAIAFTTRDWPVRQSPHTKVPSAAVA